MPMYAALGLVVIGLGGACLIVILGIPLNYLIFWIIKKCGKSYPKWLKHVLSICLPFVFAVAWCFLIDYETRTAGYHDRQYVLDGVEIPVKITSVEYPSESMRGDDFQEIKYFEIRGGSLSPEIISQLESLCLSDTSLWHKNGTKYVYYKPPMDDECKLEVTIDSLTNTGVYDYFKY